MSKIFRLYKEGSSNFQGWNESPTFPYNSNARDTISDPDGASAEHEITSIPSPFARIDLVKTAFKEVCQRAGANGNGLDGKTIFHKMVSDTLDVGEIFFNIDKYADKIEIITCDCAQMIRTLKSDGNNSHSYLADSLEKFLKSDERTYNFHKLRNIYLLNYKQGPNELNVIGATSPATLFFSGANNLEYVKDIYFPNNDRPFDNDYQPLYKRDKEYIKAWWAIRKNTPDFSKLFPEIEEYLTLTFKNIKDQSLKDALSGNTPFDIEGFAAIDVQAAGQINQVEVLGINLLKSRQKDSAKTSDFVINREDGKESDCPLVLPTEAGNKYAGLMYSNGLWGKENKAPYKNDNELDKRKLPFDGTVSPYLTISDFLEDTLLKIPHTLNKNSYFDGNSNGGTEPSSLLLPIKPLYFKYLGQETLKGMMPDGKKAIEMETLAGGSVNVTLRVPIKGDKNIRYIEFQRIYYAHRNPDINETSNEGGIAELEFSGFCMPGVRFQNENEALYTITCVTTFSTKLELQFFKGYSRIRNTSMDCRNKAGEVDYKAETYTLDKTNFDYIRVVRSDGLAGLLMPNFPPQQEIETFSFAVDLGTSNTHVEMKKANENSSYPLTYSKNERTMSKFFVQHFVEEEGNLLPTDLTDEEDLMNAEFVPEIIDSNNSDLYFPTRTALSCAKVINWNDSLRVFGLLNFNLTYNKKKAFYAYNAEPLINLKWSNENNAQAQIRLFVENLLLLLRNKVVANNGNLRNTQITWFYPNSMSQRRLSQLRDAWKDAYSKLFSQNGGTTEMSESTAPIRYYFHRYANATSIINVDIGGGTTDIAFSNYGKVSHITSFKFAANALFQDSFSDINPNNGIVDWFKGDFLELLTKNHLNDLEWIFKSNEGQPANMASFLFSLKNNSHTAKIARESIDFNHVLQNDEKFKIVFILFYTAIIYHIAQIAKKEAFGIPHHIAFSGNGSKVIHILTSDVKTLQAYTQKIFEKVMGQTSNSTLEILGVERDSSPKEATCKGGLVAAGAHDKNETKQVTLRDSSGALVGENDTYAQIDDARKDEIVKTVEDFFDFALKEIPSVFNLDDIFGVSHDSLKIAREECKKDLRTYLDKGLKMSIEESGNKDNRVEDALSFYPLKGAIQALSAKIQEYYKSNKQQ